MKLYLLENHRSFFLSYVALIYLANWAYSVFNGCWFSRGVSCWKGGRFCCWNGGRFCWRFCGPYSWRFGGDGTRWHSSGILNCIFIKNNQIKNNKKNYHWWIYTEIGINWANADPRDANLIKVHVELVYELRELQIIRRTARIEQKETGLTTCCQASNYLDLNLAQFRVNTYALRIHGRTNKLNITARLVKNFNKNVHRCICGNNTKVSGK